MTNLGVIAAASVIGGGGGGAFPVAPKVWYRADQVTGLANGDPGPATLADQSGNGFTATKGGSSIVTYQTGATPKGGPSLFHDPGANSQPSGYSFASLAGMTAASAFIVLKRGARGVNVGPWNLRTGDGSYYTYSDGNAYEGSFLDSSATRASFATSLTTYHIFHIAVGGGTLSAYINNVLQASTTYTTFTPPTAPAIGRVSLSGPDIGWNGEWAEFVLFDTALSGTDRAAVVSTLTSRHL